jgi:hypothetical protein
VGAEESGAIAVISVGRTAKQVQDGRVDVEVAQCAESNIGLAKSIVVGRPKEQQPMAAMGYPSA